MISIYRKVLLLLKIILAVACVSLAVLWPQWRAELRAQGDYIMLSPPSIDFGTVSIGSSSAAQVVTISNVQNGDPPPFVLQIGNITLTGTKPDDYFLQNDNCSGNSLGVGGFCTLEVVFDPFLPGVLNANINIPSNPAPFSSTALLPLTGIGTANMPVTYLVIYDGVTPIPTITFELHSDSGCTSAFHTETIPVDDPNLLIQSISVDLGLIPITGFKLNFVLTDVTPQPVYFLKAIGGGISGVREDCQQQPLFFTTR